MTDAGLQAGEAGMLREADFGAVGHVAERAVDTVIIRLFVAAGGRAIQFELGVALAEVRLDIVGVQRYDEFKRLRGAVGRSFRDS